MKHTFRFQLSVFTFAIISCNRSKRVIILFQNQCKIKIINQIKYVILFVVCTYTEYIYIINNNGPKHTVFIA